MRLQTVLIVVLAVLFAGGCAIPNMHRKDIRPGTDFPLEKLANH
ncbi:MAG: hypothetical protein ABI459_02720 [Deltaproteobacteria bacterium]